MIQTIAGVIGGIVIVLALIGFVRSIWPRPPKRERDHEDFSAVPDSHHNTDTGGHGGANS